MAQSLLLSTRLLCGTVSTIIEYVNVSAKSHILQLLLSEAIRKCFLHSLFFPTGFMLAHPHRVSNNLCKVKPAEVQAHQLPEVLCCCKRREWKQSYACNYWVLLGLYPSLFVKAQCLRPLIKHCAPFLSHYFFTAFSSMFLESGMSLSCKEERT